MSYVLAVVIGNAIGIPLGLFAADCFMYGLPFNLPRRRRQSSPLQADWIATGPYAVMLGSDATASGESALWPPPADERYRLVKSMAKPHLKSGDAHPVS